MNDEKWNTATDGGALRLYLNSQDCTVPSEAEPLPHVDIEPWNGRLLIFDSRLVHAVRPNTSAQKQRRALTLWINRPNHSGVRGEVYY